VTTGAHHSDLQQIFVKHSKVATHPEITAALDGIISLQVAQKRIHTLFWEHYQDLDLLWRYGEFLYLSGYDTHPDLSIASSLVYDDCETTRTIKELALEQWRAVTPAGYPGYLWLHTSDEKDRAQGIKQMWQVSVYHRYENALVHDISNRLSTCKDGKYWDHTLCYWYRNQVPYGIDYNGSMISEFHDGRLQVVKNYSIDWKQANAFPTTAPIRPHAPAFITEPFEKPSWKSKPYRVW
jgi:hypothetical protein